MPAQIAAPVPGPTLHQVILVLLALTAIRLAGLYVSQVDLYVDEAQYWAWSRELAFGYFSKPPLLAWIIAATDTVCGNGEACVRSASPLLYLGTSLLIYAIARELYDARVAAWSALVFALATGLSFSARIISTDVPLLFFWALALLAYVKLLRAPDWRFAIPLGVACGLGLLAKYAMIYFIGCAICAALVDRDARLLLRRPQIWVALILALLIVSPNLYWNIENGLATFKHTGGNITGAGFRLRPFAPFEFIGAQFALAGPLVFAGFLYILAKARSVNLPTDRLMLAFALPPLVLVALFGFVRNLNANWAAMSVISLVVIVVAWWVRNGERRWIVATLAIGVVAQAAMLVADAYADKISLPLLGRNADLYQRTLGWRGLGAQAAQLGRDSKARTVTSEPRAEVAALIYYLRDEPFMVRSWPTAPEPVDQFDISRPMTETAAQPVLYIGFCADTARLKEYYNDVTPLGPFITTAGPHTTRHYFAFKLTGPRKPIAELAPCP